MTPKRHSVTSCSAEHLTPAEREQIQDHLVRRYLQLNDRIFGRRRTDKRLPPSIRTDSQAVWYIKRQLG